MDESGGTLFPTQPPQIPECLIKETLSYDVVIVGAGTAGLAAAVSAAEEHAQVALLEKGQTFTARGGDNTALNSRMHRQLGISIDVEEVVRKLMETSGYRADERLIRLWAYNSGKVMDWLIDLCQEAGVKTWLIFPDRVDRHAFVINKWPLTDVPNGWDFKKETHVEYPTCHRFGDNPTCNQTVLLKTLESKAKKLNVDIRYGTEAKKIERASNGRATAVIAKTGDIYVRFIAEKGIILATGDYGANKTLVKHFLPEDFAKVALMMPARYRMGTGDGHIMAHWIGAQFESKPHAAIVHSWHAMGTAPFLMVDKFGKRFVNEDLGAVSFTNQCLKRGGVWVIFDSNWPEHVKKLGPGFFRIWKADELTLTEFQQKLESGKVIQAETLDELGQKMHSVTPELSIEHFKQAVKRYNEICRMGKDVDFGKRPDRLFPVEKPPFYANWNQNAFFFASLGGLIVNENLQPIDEKGEPILGLYCVGNLVGGRFGLDYPLICPGLSHSMAWTYGYIAGKHVIGKNA